MKNQKPIIKTQVIRKSSGWAKFGMFMLGILAGIIILVGTIAGVGYWAYKNLNMNTLENFGVTVPTETIPDDSPLREMTLELLIQEIGNISSGMEETSLNGLIEKYKLKLPESITKYIPPAAMTIPVAQLFSSSGITSILDGTDGSYILTAFGMNDPLMTKLFSGKSLSVFLSGDFAKITAGMYVGDVMGYIKSEADGWVDGSGAPIAGTMKTFAEMELSTLFDGTFNMDSVMNTVYIGDVIGFHRLQEKDADGNPIVDAEGNPVYEKDESGKEIWHEASGGAAKGFMAILAPLTVGDLSKPDTVTNMLNDIKIGDVITIGESSPAILRALKDTTIGGLSVRINTLYVGEAMGLYPKNAGTAEVPVYEWYKDKEMTVPAAGLEAMFADLKVSELNGDTLQSRINLLKVKDLFSMDTGIFTLISDPNVTVQNLPNQLIKDISTANMGKLKTAGILSDSMVQSLANISKVVYRNNLTAADPIRDESGNAAAPVDCWQYCDMTSFFAAIAASVTIP